MISSYIYIYKYIVKNIQGASHRYMTYYDLYIFADVYTCLQIWIHVYIHIYFEICIYIYVLRFERKMYRMIQVTNEYLLSGLSKSS